MKLSNSITAARDATSGPGFDDVDEVCCILEKAIEVIRFYAENEWDIGCGCCASGDGSMWDDCGKKAKEFLKELEV